MTGPRNEVEEAIRLETERMEDYLMLLEMEEELAPEA